MTIYKLTTKERSADSLNQANEFGEYALPFAPEIELSDGTSAVPQQFLNVRRTLQSVEKILSQIEFSDKYLLFAGRVGHTVFIQVGIIGPENYPRQNQDPKQLKIVYGRRWMLEPTTPTSEVVQTALLAIKKAREHELREKLTFKSDDGVLTTPFNSHQDLPLMAGRATFFVNDQNEALEKCLSRLQFSQMNFRLYKCTHLSKQQIVVEVDMIETDLAEALFPEMLGKRLAISGDVGNTSLFTHRLISELITASDRYVDEQFSYQGFARFSHCVDVSRLADFSYQTRSVQAQDNRFNSYFKDMSYQVDSAKAPDYAAGVLGKQQRAAINSSGMIGGYMPNASADVGACQIEPRLRKALSK